MRCTLFMVVISGVWERSHPSIKFVEVVGSGLHDELAGRVTKALPF